LTYTAPDLRALAGDTRPHCGLCVRFCLRLTCGGPRGTTNPLSLVINQRNMVSARLSTELVNQLIRQSPLAGSMSSRFATRLTLWRNSCAIGRDLLALTKTWHTDSNDVCLRLATPEEYAIADVARTPGHAGGGVAIIFNKSLKCSRIPVLASSMFEAICV